MKQIFEVNLHQARPQIQMAKCLVYDIMGCVMKVLNDLGDLDGNNIFEEFKIFERIEKCKTVLSIQEELTDIFKKICENSMNESVEKVNRLIEDVKTFVSSYYDDPNLSCEVISDHFKMHQSYLSTVFRKYTNQGLLEYIVKMRVEKAKQLLREPGMTVEKTAVRVGSVSYTHLSSHRRGRPSIITGTTTAARLHLKWTTSVGLLIWGKMITG